MIHAWASCAFSIADRTTFKHQLQPTSNSLTDIFIVNEKQTGMLSTWLLFLKLINLNTNVKLSVQRLLYCVLVELNGIDFVIY